MDGNSIVERISCRQQKLFSAANSLKKHFVGLDFVIDKLAKSVEAWYCLPEILTRPTIVCLWGLTGTGKTDLVRRFVKSLDMVDNFVEIQMTNKGSSQHVYSSTLQGLLASSNVSSESPGILLLDEIQRFRSIDTDGKDIYDYKFQDVWMLLSDGSFGGASDNKDGLFEMLFESLYWDDYHRAQEKTEKTEEEKKAKATEEKRKFRQNYWSARQMKRQLRLPEPVEEIMQWDSRRKIDILTEKMDDKSIYDADVYRQLLVFVSGNIDEAYGMAMATDETDIDADIFHKHSLGINLLTIKDALRKRFKPEQIARFGNTHIVYPALSKLSYEEIIRRKIQEVLDSVELNSGICIEADQSVYDAIYRNGVFPAQGTRPVFSTISSFFESSLPHFIIVAMKKSAKRVLLRYEDKHLVAKIGGETVSVRNEGDIDKIKNDKRSPALTRKVAVHEAGHAVAYSVLFGLVPTQVQINVASEDRAGFVGFHTMDETFETISKRTVVCLAGRVAQQIVFGEQLCCGGASSDIAQATGNAARVIRAYGMGKFSSRIVPVTVTDSQIANLDVNSTNKLIDKFVAEKKEEANTLVRNHLRLLLDLTDHLIVHEKVAPQEYIEICKKNGVAVREVDAKEVIFPSYEGIYDRFHCSQNRKEME